MAEIIAQPPLVPQRAGSLLAAAYTPAGRLVRDQAHAYRGSACQAGWRYLDPCGTQTVDNGFANSSGGIIQSSPVAFEVKETCSAMGSREDREARALARLRSVESAAIAREFWTGALADAAGLASNPRLESGAGQPNGATVDVNAAGAVGPLAGLALLEGELATRLNGQPGMIHGTRRAITSLLDVGQITREGDLLVTAFGTRVVGDAGYPGTSPTGAAPAAGQAWLYGTARPTVLTSEPEVVEASQDQALDRGVNTFTYDAYEAFVVLLECSIIAVRITLPT